MMLSVGCCLSLLTLQRCYGCYEISWQRHQKDIDEINFSTSMKKETVRIGAATVSLVCSVTACRYLQSTLMLSGLFSRYSFM